MDQGSVVAQPLSHPFKRRAPHRQFAFECRVLLVLVRMCYLGTTCYWLSLCILKLYLSLFDMLASCLYLLLQQYCVVIGLVAV